MQLQAPMPASLWVLYVPSGAKRVQWKGNGISRPQLCLLHAGTCTLMEADTLRVPNTPVQAASTDGKFAQVNMPCAFLFMGLLLVTWLESAVVL